MTEPQRATILIMAGGTGGHVFPALAVAEVLARRGARVHWLGTRRGLESEMVPRAGIPIHYIRVAGLRGKGALQRLQGALALMAGFWQSLSLIWRLRPGCVLGLGGYVAGPGGVAAWLLRRPLLIHEQNAVPGTTNRLLARLARRVLSGFPGDWAGTRGTWIGNPVRAAIARLPEPEQRWVQRSGPLRLLVLGGSLGAQPLNTLVPAALAGMDASRRPLVWHQTGRGNDAGVRADYSGLKLDARVDDFISDMAQAYAWADVVLCRAGALTIAELTAAGIGALLVPLPHAIDDHQSANARWLVARGAGRLLPQAQLSPQRLGAELEQLFDLDREEQILLQWARNARAAARPGAAEHVADACLEVARER